MTSTWAQLPPHSSWTRAQERVFVEFATGVARSKSAVDITSFTTQPHVARNPALLAALHVLADLGAQGWKVRVKNGQTFVSAPATDADPDQEKQRVRRQELIKRDEQLSRPSVRRFVAEMER